MTTIKHPRGKTASGRLALLLGATLFLGCPAEATILANVNGKVLVNQGDGFKEVSASVPLVEGDRVRSGGGSADIIYDSGIVHHVKAGQTSVVMSPSSASGFSPSPSVPTGSEGASSNILGLGALAGAGIGIGTLLASDNNNKNSTLEYGAVGKVNNLHVQIPTPPITVPTPEPITTLPADLPFSP